MSCWHCPDCHQGSNQTPCPYCGYGAPFYEGLVFDEEIPGCDIESFKTYVAREHPDIKVIIYDPPKIVGRY